MSGWIATRIVADTSTVSIVSNTNTSSPGRSHRERVRAALGKSVHGLDPNGSIAEREVYEGAEVDRGAHALVGARSAFMVQVNADCGQRRVGKLVVRS